MLPVDILMSEHRVIEMVLDCLEKIAEGCAGEGGFDADSARQSVDFFRNFADRCHHGKEESHVFPLLETKGFSPEMGPTGVMRSEHDQGRKHVAAMADAIEQAAAGDSAAVGSFADHARSFVELLREHIQKEDHCLFPMANQAFSDEEQQSLLKTFEKVEHDEMGPGTHEKFLGIAFELADRFGVCKEKAIAGGGCGCSHGHKAEG